MEQEQHDPQAEGDTRLVRSRVMTDKAKEQYREKSESLHNTLMFSLSSLRKCATDVLADVPVSEREIQIVERNLEKRNEFFCDHQNEYLDYIGHYQSYPEGKEDLNKHDSDPELQDVRNVVKKAFQRLAEKKRELWEQMSNGKSSSKSVVSEHLLKKRAEVEGAKAGLKFAVEEAEIQKEVSRLQTELQLLEKKKQLAVTEAEADFMEKASEGGSVKSLPALNLEPQSSQEKAQVFVNSLPHSEPVEISESVMDHAIPTSHQISYGLGNQLPVGHGLSNSDNNNNFTFPVPDQSSLAKYLCKKDIIKETLYSFSGRSEEYLCWKDAFKNVVREMDASATEELNLLIRWCGPGAKCLISIKSANSGHPAIGLKRGWDRLDSQYGAPEKIEYALREKLNNVPRLTYKDKGKLYDLLDVLEEIRAVKEKAQYKVMLTYLDTASGVNPIVNKLPQAFQNKWRDRAMAYKRAHHVSYPPFTHFCSYIRDIAETENDPSFDFENASTAKTSASGKNDSGTPQPHTVHVAKTMGNDDNGPAVFPCFIHKGSHALMDCRTFKHKTLDDRRKLLKEQGACFRCCEGKHLSRDCKAIIKCGECGAQNHCTAMHIYSRTRIGEANHGGEDKVQSQNSTVTVVDAKCSELCSGDCTSKSCAKIVLVNIRNAESRKPPIRGYVIIDDQSNCSLVKPGLLDYFAVDAVTSPYSLRTCNGNVTLYGRRATGFQIEALDGSECMKLPVVTECDMIPENRNEIPSPEIAKNHPHLASISNQIPPIDDTCDIVMLIGRDLLPAHQVLDQILGRDDQPFAQRLRLGWVIVGECCLDGVHMQPNTNLGVMKTFVHTNGRPTEIPIESCQNAVRSDSLFTVTDQDNKVGMSQEDKMFIKLMSSEMKHDGEGNWVAPLPFKESKPILRDNRALAIKRTCNFLTSLKHDNLKKSHTLDFMQNLLTNGHAQRAPSLNHGEEVWYLPLFGVYHPKKKDKIRIVFDSSAKFGGISLNDVLMSGPNLTNSLLGVLLRFRRERVAVIADLQQMFYSFLVRPDHRDYLRFVWPEDNILGNPLVDYHMNVHVFGNSPSPAVATFGLRRTAELARDEFGDDVWTFVNQNFYVDDGLSSHASSQEAIDVLKRTQQALQTYGNLRLHKVCSNSREVLTAFSKQDLAKDLMDLDLEHELPLQRSPGVCWNMELDTFTFKTEPYDVLFTKRGVLSVVNGLYDPLGFLAPFTIMGKLLLRESTLSGQGWDEQLSEEFLQKWLSWKESFALLGQVQVPRMYCSPSAGEILATDLYVYSDASEKAVAAVAYVVSHDKAGNSHSGFALGKAKVAPKHGHTIPRLELCAAVLAVEIYETCRDEMGYKFRHVRFFTDSKVTLGYIHNQTKRFFIYVANRVDRIRAASIPKQWSYINTASNPADDATRGLLAQNLSESKWLNFSSHVLGEDLSPKESYYPLVLPETDNEVRTLKTEHVQDARLDCKRFERFSSWHSVIRGVSRIKFGIRAHVQLPDLELQIKIRSEAQNLVIMAMQSEAFGDEIDALRKGKCLPRNSSIRNLSPYIDTDGILRVGGRLNQDAFDLNLSHPIILPSSHLSNLLIRHFHEKNAHQGRHMTEGAIRTAGFWLLGCKRQVSRHIFNCVKCRKQRGRPGNPLMSNLPLDRVTPAPPFTNVGIDVFGPWQITTRKTRGGQINSKRWALIFTCLVVRAVHIELLEEMSSSCFINALRRFCAIRGEVSIIRSDCGTNFVGSTSDLKANVINVADRPIKTYLVDSGINWIFNPPQSSHFGGAWERIIGIARKILNSMLANNQHLTHDVLLTLMAEVTSIINARPITSVPTDPEVPFPITPNMLLTSKTNSVVSSFAIKDFDKRDIFKAQWRQVQHLANSFWKRWKSEYLPLLQSRRKWLSESRDLAVGDVVLLMDNSSHRNEWPMGSVVKTHPGEDNRIRAVDIQLGRDGNILTREVGKVILLFTRDN